MPTHQAGAHARRTQQAGAHTKRACARGPHRRVAAAACFDKALDDAGQRGGAHQQDERVEFAERGPVEGVGAVR